MSQKKIYFTSSVLPELSNFYDCGISLEVNDKIYNTSEHLYQCMKFLYFDESNAHTEFAELIRRQSTPYKAKFLASQYASGKYEWQKALCVVSKSFASRGVLLNVSWDDVRVTVMENVLRRKFSANEMCRNILMETKNTILIERTDTDAFWGDGKYGNGKNMLGILLMKIRDDWYMNGIPENVPDIMTKNGILSK